MRRRTVFLPLSLLLICSVGGTLWQDHEKLRLVCFWKTVSSQKEAVDPAFPRRNRRDIAYEYQEIMKHPDISAHFFVEVASGVELTAESLLENNPEDRALVTTRLGVKSTGRGYGDNHELRRNTSGQNYVQINEGRSSRPIFISYSCGVYELPIPAQPRLSPDESPREPPIH